MLIPIKTTSQTLDEILTDEQKRICVNTQFYDGNNGYHQFLLKNTGGSPIYIEFGADASAAESCNIQPEEVFQFSDRTFTHCNLIADAAQNITLLAN